MPELYGMTLSKREILERVGDISQICDARQMRFDDGRAEGVRSIEITTGSGLAFTLLPSRGLDISRASYRGTPLSWLSAVGETSPYYYQPEGMEWLKGFFGGLLTTCGLSHASHPCEDDGESLGLHGPVSHIPAQDVSVVKEWRDEDYHITVSGSVREVSVYGRNLVLHRTLETSLGGRSLTITDTVENAGFRTSPLMLLYHVNPGWPVLSEQSRISAPVLSSRGFDERSDAEAGTWNTFLPPQKDYEQRGWFHDMSADATGIVPVCIVNETLELGVYLSYPKKEFPYFVEWKQLGQGEYVVGIEPGNITGNRAHMRGEGTLEFIEPGAVRQFTLEIGVLAGRTEIASFIKRIEEVEAS